MSGFPRPREPVQTHSLIATPPIEPSPPGSGGSGKCLLGIVGLLLALGFVAFLGNVKINKVLKQSAVNGQKAATAIAAADAARASAEASAGLLQSIAQALNSQVAAGTLTPSELAAIAAAIKANQAARAGAAAQAGTTPGIPGSRSGGGTSVTPGVPGSAIQPVASQTTPPPSSSDTSKCLLTAGIPTILKLDGTVCPP
jgi:hypothetical protein